jgi:glycogen phosphorylase
VTGGALDLERAAAELAGRLPEPLAPLARLAYNYRWSWLPGGDALFRSLDPQRWELCLHNPVRLLQEVPPATLRRVAADSGLVERAT